MKKNMSRIEKEIKLFPPDFLQAGRKPEVLVSTRHTCPYCHGNGFFLTGVVTTERHDCPVCLGTGMLDAYVTILWKPSKNDGDGKDY